MHRLSISFYLESMPEFWLRLTLSPLLSIKTPLDFGNGYTQLHIDGVNYEAQELCGMSTNFPELIINPRYYNLLFVYSLMVMLQHTHGGTL